MAFYWLANIYVNYPNIILLVLLLFSGTCLIIPLTSRNLPDFSDPQMGFETRGTPLAQKIMTWKNLIEATKPSGIFSSNPKELLLRRNLTNLFKRKKRDRLKTFMKNSTDNSKKTYISEKNLFANGYFCGHPDANYVHIVYKSKNDKDLFQLEPLNELCRLEKELVESAHYQELCVMTTRKQKRCCKPWSLNNYVAILSGHKTCLEITEEDIVIAKALLLKCSKYYYSSDLEPDCFESGQCNAPMECIEQDAIYNIMHYLMSTSFLPANESNYEHKELKETIIFLPMACSVGTFEYYNGLSKVALSHNTVHVVAMEFGLKNALFDEMLITDSWLMILGGVFVVICMWLYTKSLFLTFMTITAIVFSLGISYFFYTIVFNLRFFPFMNLLAIIVAIGIGADDAFIFCKVWHTIKDENSDDTSIKKLMAYTLYHSLITMFVTSITTAVAFLSSYGSSITALRCFGIFSGMAVLVNYILMISWLPLAIIVYQKWGIVHWTLRKSCILIRIDRLCYMHQWKVAISKKRTSFDRVWTALENNILNVVIQFKVLFFFTFTLIAVLSALVVFYYPKLQLPSNNEFQLFDSSHPFEQYDMIYKNKFLFNRLQKIDGDTDVTLPLRFIWGLLPTDNGDYMDPQNKGELELDSEFDVSHPVSQIWLVDFCKDLRKQPFYQHTPGFSLSNCFIETFIEWMDRPCNDTINDTNLEPCCKESIFPYNSSVFNQCIVDAIYDLYKTPSTYFIPGMAGPKFSKESIPTIKTVVVEYDSNYTYSMSFEYMKEFLDQVESWFEIQLKSAPVNMKGGLFITEAEFFDLQRVLSENTIQAVMISMALALFILFVTTLNILNSIFAIFTITCSITTTMALLVLSGWKLNILESVAISSTIGLTVDFSLHYTVNYKLCPINITDNRERVTKYALLGMFGPTSMAAITTAFAGVFMIPSSVLAYKQIGQFLVIVMLVSWMFAVFHLGSLLAIAGPERQFGQFYYSNILCCNKKSRRSQPTQPSSSDTNELENFTAPRVFYENVERQPKSSNCQSESKYIFVEQPLFDNNAINLTMTANN